ncbi:MAG: potassium channel family protein [Candidatus Baldrarchaeia archaeon]
MGNKRITYKAIPVLELLKEMKDLSGLMIDLAYSAFLYNNKDLAKEVMRLEEKVDELCNLLLMTSALAVRDREDAEQMLAIMKTAISADEISNAAADIANLVFLGVVPHRAIVSAFLRAEKKVARIKVSKDSVLVGKKLGDLLLEARVGADVIAIRRGREWILDPDKDFEIRENDVIIARGTPEGVEELERIACGVVPSLPEVMKWTEKDTGKKLSR